MALRLIFRAGEERIALPAEDVREVVPLGRTTRVPHAPAALVGLGNVRGTVMPMVSVDALLGRPPANGRRVIVLDRDDPIGLIVEDVPHLAEEARDARTLDLAALLDESFAAARRPAAAMSDRAAAGRGAGQAAAERADDQIALLSFMVSGQVFALPLDQIDEAIALPGDIARLPGADGVALGSIEHRGHLLPLLSIRALLDLTDHDAPAKPRILVARIRGRRLGLVIDALGSIDRVGEAMIDPLPLVLSRGKAEAKIQAIVRRRDGGGLVSLLATDQLLNEAVMARLTDDQSQEPSTVPTVRDSTERLLVFGLGEEEFALPIACVREVVALPDRLTSMPRAPAFVAGIMNLRGRAVALIDQRRRFEVPGEARMRRRVIIAALDDLEAGFVVDRVTEVLAVPASQLTPAPAMGDDTRVFDRVASLDGGARTVLVIEPRALLDRAERDLLAAMHDAGAAAPL